MNRQVMLDGWGDKAMDGKELVDQAAICLGCVALGLVGLVAFVTWLVTWLIMR
jgi:hypothetical protein